MRTPYDATLKHLLEAYPQDWAALLGVTGVAVETVEADLSAVTAEADKVFRVADPDPWIMHVELQASYDAELPRRMSRYNTMLDLQLGLPVRSSVLLLRPEAGGPQVNGSLQRHTRGRMHLDFRYDVVRVWELPAEVVLQSGLGVVPLAPIVVKADEVPEVVRRMAGRLDETSSAEAASLWTATYILMGLRYPSEFTQRMLREVRAMKESVTYQAIIEEGRQVGLLEGRQEGRQEGIREGLDEAADRWREAVLRLGERRLGAPGEGMRVRLEAVKDLDQLSRLSERMLDVESWEELLG